jgi:hypothetical protein
MPPTEPITNERIALALDPERRNFDWWLWQSMDGQDPVCAGYTGPDFTHDDLAAFIHLRPVVLALGCKIEIYIDHIYIEYLATGSAWSAPIFCEALCLALSYFLQHAPDALAQSVREVRGV